MECLIIIIVYISEVVLLDFIILPFYQDLGEFELKLLLVHMFELHLEHLLLQPLIVLVKGYFGVDCLLVQLFVIESQHLLDIFIVQLISQQTHSEVLLILVLDKSLLFLE